MIHVFRTKEKINLICQEIVAWFQREEKVSKYKNSSEATEEITGNVTCLLHNKEGIFQKGGGGIHVFHSFLTYLFNLLQHGVQSFWYKWMYEPIAIWLFLGLYYNT